MKVIEVNSVKLYRYHSPHFPNAFIFTGEKRFYAYNPFTKTFIVGGGGWYEINGERRWAPDAYRESGEVNGVKIRKIIYDDGKLDSAEMYVGEKFFAKKIGKVVVVCTEDGCNEKVI